METSYGYSSNYQYSGSFAASRRDVTYRKFGSGSIPLKLMQGSIDILHCMSGVISYGEKISNSFGMLTIRLQNRCHDVPWLGSYWGWMRPNKTSCGSCGYDLNLNSSSRNMSTFGSKYGKSIKKGIISFFSIDESRFSQIEEFSCVPYFISKHSWGFFRRKTKLLCRKCGNHIGYARDDNNANSYHLITNGSGSPSGTEISNKRKYDIKIRSLQPSSAGFGTPLVL
ncbi:hypothetical protein DH2020_033929 [Rehmannia glutinosa]|uniref:Uncharacterized protein n=1 Tax=Rehmannia glutinosa TaxID=99300 RepID=A0ABR0VAS8_REHGL